MDQGRDRAQRIAHRGIHVPAGAPGRPERDRQRTGQQRAVLHRPGPAAPIPGRVIQRHYLTQAEAHMHDRFMPRWAEEVCRRWRAVLDGLRGGWEWAATSLDWAIYPILTFPVVP